MIESFSDEEIDSFRRDGFRRRGDLSLDESLFPVVWDETGYRTPWLGELPQLA